MAPLKFISLSVGSLVLLQATHATQTLGDVATEDVHEKMHNNCLDEFNTARNAVGFPKYTGLTIEDPESLTTVCAAIKKNETTGTTSVQEGVNFIYALQAENDCAQLVKTVNAAFEKLGSTLPPEYTKASPDAVYNQQTINFMALYNPLTAQVSCSFVTCGKKKDSPTRRLSGGDAGISAVACAVKPGTVKEGAAPYTQEEYNKILAVFAPSSASAAVPTFLALAAAAAGIAFM